jgi:hypothetical protein
MRGEYENLCDVIFTEDIVPKIGYGARCEFNTYESCDLLKIDNAEDVCDSKPWLRTVIDVFVDPTSADVQPGMEITL